MDIATRLKKILIYSELSVSDFCKKCNLSEDSFIRLCRGQSDMKLQTLLNILKTYPEISADWFFKDNAPMFRPEYLDMVEQKLKHRISILRDTINSQDETIAALNERIRQLENQLKSK